MIPDVYSVIREKTGQNYCEYDIFFRKFPIDFIGPNEMKLYIAQKMSKNKMSGYHLFTEVLNTT